MKIPKCMTCNRMFEDNKELPTCEAFPEGIPHDVMWREFEEECNNGMKYEAD